ncbi:MAG: glutathione S-transferase family protein [Beijerinckiaceae bacterium]
MILIGQYDSPFVRRVGIALTLYGMAFEHRPWSAFGDSARIKHFNPLLRVPTLVLASGETLIESTYILDYLDSLAAPDLVMLPASEPERRQALKVISLATGAADKAVSLFYELRLHNAVSDLFVDRCRAQITAVMDTLTMDHAGRISPYWFGDRISHADVAVAAMLRFISEAHPGLVTMTDYAALSAHAAQMEALPVFQAISQPFVFSG